MDAVTARLGIIYIHNARARFLLSHSVQVKTFIHPFFHPLDLVNKRLWGLDVDKGPVDTLVRGTGVA